LTITSWQTKNRLGQLPEGSAAMQRFFELTLADRLEHLPISYLHSIRSGADRLDYRDLFERMLAAQAKIEVANMVGREGLEPPTKGL
jgi:PIN domain nuclease of toxin-antitoxin system